MDLCMDLPPGFRFHPTDEEIITHYLSPKVINPSFSARAIGEVDFNKCEPWDLPSKAKMGEKEWYFFFKRDRKYPTGMRTNRATEAGYWKATGKDKEIYRGKGLLVGMKKTLVFYTGRAPKGEKSNWVMHEFRLQSFNNTLPKSAKDEWVVSKVFHKSNEVKKSPMVPLARMSSFGDLLLESDPNLPPLIDSAPNYFNNNDESFDFNLSATSFNPMGFINNYNFNQLGSSTSMDPLAYLHQDHQHKVQCKLEQFPNHSMLSDDTGLSTDRNTEISSVVSSYDDIINAPPPAAGMAPLDLDNMWKC